MDFSALQLRFLNNKKSRVQVLKGELSTGKTTVSLYKGVDLENNYCIYDNDKVAFITSTVSNVRAAKETYSTAKEQMRDEFYSLFSQSSKSKLDVLSISELTALYANAYMREKKLFLKYSKKSVRLKKLENVYNEYISSKKSSRFLDNCGIEYLLEEIEWIKACAFDKSEYMICKRTGRKKSIKSNSITREQIFDICEIYTCEMINLGYIDKYDEILFAIKKASSMKKSYTHIILDDCESLLRSEFKLIDAIRNIKRGFYIMLINKVDSSRDNIWLKNGRNIASITDMKTKNFIFRSKFKVMKDEHSIEKYKYKDIIHSKTFDFIVDTLDDNEVILYKDGVEKSVEKKDLTPVNVFSNIAAGSPIEINDELTNKINLPKEFLGKYDDVFVLNVKGDSMINKGIDDGDLVIIKKQSTAYNNEVVAVNINGSATLKTLNLDAKKPLLMPANEKYEPIKLEGEDVCILGKLIGVLKKC